MTEAAIFDRAAEAATLALYWRREAERMRGGATVAGCNRRQALALARRCERAVFDLAIAAEQATWAARDSADAQAS